MTADRLTPQRETEIAARAEAATPGPWGLYDDETGLIDVAADLEDTGHGYRCRRYIGQLEADQIDNDPTHRDWTEEQDRAQVAADAAFIAHAREDVDLLRAELAAVRAERDEARARVAEPHTPRICECGHGHLAHTVPAPHSCFAFGQTCPCKAYRQLPHDEAVAQLARNRQAAAERASEEDPTAEHHTVDGIRYLCHADDHYCPSGGEPR